MKPAKPQNAYQSKLFRSRLDGHRINMGHELMRLAALIDWRVFDDRYNALYYAEVSCPGKPTGQMTRVL